VIEKGDVSLFRPAEEQEVGVTRLRRRRFYGVPTPTLSGRRRGLLLSLLSLAACQPAPPAPHGAAARPTIVSLNPCADAVLDQVTRPGQLLAVSHFSRDPASSSMGVAAASRYRAVSNSVEEIARLSPDVVVADVFLPPATGQALRDLGIRVVTIGSVDTVAAAEAQVRELAATAGDASAGERLVGRIEAVLTREAPAPGTPALSAIVWESGGIVAGDSTLVADLLRRTGFTNAAAARGLRQADYLPLEAMLANPPQVIFAVGSDNAEEDRLLSHPALRGLTGTRRVPLDGALLWCGGPTIVRAAERLGAVRRGLT